MFEACSLHNTHMGKKKQTPNPDLTREYIKALAGLLDGCFSLTKIPTSEILARLQLLHVKLHGLISVELKKLRDTFDTWQKLPTDLPTDKKALDIARITWRNGEGPLHRFMDSYARWAMTVESAELSNNEAVQCQSLQREVDEALAEAEASDLARMRDQDGTDTQTEDDDETALRQLTRCFDRPAFYTPFYQEASLPDFRKAMTDTIEALNTGIRRLRHGTFIERVRPRDEFADTLVREKLARIERKVVEIRAKFIEFLRDGKIQAKLVPGSPVQEYLAEQTACLAMDGLRTSVLDSVRRLQPTFVVTLAPDASTLAYPAQLDDDGRVRIGAELTPVPARPVKWSNPTSISKLAKMIGVGRKTLAIWIKRRDGNGIRFKKVGTKYCVALDDLPIPLDSEPEPA